MAVGPVAAGLYVGVFLATAGVRYATTGGPGFRYITAPGLPGVASPSTSVSIVGIVSIGWSITVGSSQRLSSLEMSQGATSEAGIGLLASADATGGADATAVFAAAKAGSQQVYVPPGNYAVTALPQSGQGLWGPGRVLVNGVRYPLPARPRDGALLLDVRSALAQLTSSGSPLVIIGDSLTAHFSAGTLARSYVSQIEDFLNQEFAPGSEPTTSVMINDTGTTGETAAFYGVTNSNVSAGTNGPVSKSTILADGGYIEFTGTYQTVEVFYQQASGAGTLTRTINGGSGVAISAAGTAQSDKLTAFGATGQTGSATYRITASGGPVELTGLVRFANKLAAAGTPEPLRVMRQAYGGYDTEKYFKASGGNSGAMVSGSAVMTGVSAAVTPNLLVGMLVTGTNVAPGSRILSIDSATQITLSKVSTGTVSGNIGFYLPTPLRSIVTQALAIGPNPEYWIALQTNNMFFGRTPRVENFQADLQEMIAFLKTTGQASRVNVITPSRPLYSSWSSLYAAGETFDQYIAAAQKAAAAAGAALCRLDQFDFYNAGLLSATDKLHWTDAGHDKVADILLAWRAAL